MSEPRPVVSIVICTANRADDLRQTLASMMRVDVPANLPAEVLVVDNASTDHTRLVVEGCAAHGAHALTPRYLFEPRRGKGYAYNVALAAARGNVYLFTDDDVRVPADWIAGMCGPIVTGHADAVAGGFCSPPDLVRPWMASSAAHGPTDSSFLDAHAPHTLVGLNMAFARRVLERVPAFDTELGPGALGFGDDTLFAMQIERAGFRLTAAKDVRVEHHYDASRLARGHLLARAEKVGRSEAYVAHHWLHGQIPLSGLRLAKHRLNLWLWRRLRARDCAAVEGLAQWEFDLLRRAAFLRHYRALRQAPRRYDREGLVVRAAARAGNPGGSRP